MTDATAKPSPQWDAHIGAYISRVRPSHKPACPGHGPPLGSIGEGRSQAGSNLSARFDQEGRIIPRRDIVGALYPAGDHNQGLGAADGARRRRLQIGMAVAAACAGIWLAYRNSDPIKYWVMNIGGVIVAGLGAWLF